MPRLLVATTLWVLAAIAVGSLIMPHWRAIGSSRQEITRLQSLHEELNQLAERRDELTRAYNAIPEADLVKLTAIVPRDPASASVLADFEALTRKHGLVLERVEFLAGDRTATTLGIPSARLYRTLPVAMNLRGSYESFRAFLTGLEQNLRLFDATEINFTGTQAAQFSVTLKGVMYVRQ